MPYRVGSKSSPTASPMVPSLACLSDRLIRRRSRSMSMILTKISSPTCTTCSGISTCRSSSPEMWTRPSMPSTTRTNAPNGNSLVTRPGTTWPIWWVRANCCHGSSCVALSDRETRSFFFQAEDGIRDLIVTGVQTCALPISTRVSAYVSVETRVEETGRILQRRALGEGKLHDILVGFASADDAVVRPNRSAHPLPLLDDVRVCFLDELAHSAEGFPAPVPEFGDSFRDQLRCRLALARARFFHG